jgi:hypothetical protein
MRAALLVFVGLLAIAGAQVSTFSVLTKANKFAISQTNAHYVETMDIRTQKWLKDFLGDLEAHATYVQLSPPLANGHSVVYKFLEGNRALLNSLGSKHKVSVSADRLSVHFPDVVAATALDANSPQAAATKTKPYGLAGNPIAKDLKAQRRRDFRLFGTDKAARNKWYYDNNMAQISKMKREARPVMEWLLKQVATTKTLIELQTPVRKGHIIRFVVIKGSAADVQRFGAPCKLKVTGDTVEIPVPGQCHVTSDADVGTSPTAQHEVNSNDIDPESGVLKPIPNLVPTEKRNVVKALPEKWIKEP